MDRHYGYVPKFRNTWEVDFDKDRYLNDREIYEDFESTDDFGLHTLFGAICDDDFVDEEEICEEGEEMNFLIR